MRLIFTVVICLSSALFAGAWGQSVIRGPYLQLGTPNRVLVSWRTDSSTTSVVRYGSDPASLPQTVTVPGSRVDHVVSITGLTPNTRYYYSVGTTSLSLNGGPDQYFETAPPFGEAKPTRVWVLGDSGTANSDAAQVRDAFYGFNGSSHTDLLLMLGDNAYTSGTDAEYQAAVFDMYPETLRNTVLWPTLGNHDALSTTTTLSSGENGIYYDIFILPDAGQAGGTGSGLEGYYSFDYGNVHFICLNSSQGDLGYAAAMLAWLQADVASSLQEWMVAFWHHPPYSRGSHDSDVEGQLIWMRQNVLPILESGGVDLVLNGHSHSYERSMLIDGHYGYSSTFDPLTHVVDPGDGGIHGNGAYQKEFHGHASNSGSVYLVCGSSGKVTSGFLDHPVMLHGLLELGSVVLDVDGSQMDVTFLDNGGVAADRFTLVKGNVTPMVRYLTLVEMGGTWSYDDSDTDYGGGWCLPGCDISSWSSGFAPLGFGENGVVTETNPGVATNYFVKQFQFDGEVADVSRMRLNVDYDDGFVAHLNGNEIARSDNLSGAVVHGTLAGSHESGAAETFDVTNMSGMLLTGKNILAVEVHQTSLGSTDIFLDAGLEVELLQPYLEDCARGTITDGSGNLVDTLLVNGSSGAVARSVDVHVGVPLTIDVLAPPVSGSVPPLFMLGALLGTAGSDDVFGPLGSFGPMCFDILGPYVIKLANNLLPVFPAVLPSGPAPWSYTHSAGVYAPIELTIQGVILTGPGSLGVTNAVRVNVIP